MCASVKASCPRPQTLSRAAARGKTREAKRALGRTEKVEVEEDSRIDIVLCLVILDFTLRVS